MPVRTIKVLRAARKLVANPKTWTQLAAARDPDGEAQPATSPDAVCWCAWGAMVQSAVRLGLSTRDTDPLDDALNKLAERRGFSGLIGANDQHGRLAALQVIDDAIAELKARGEA